MPLAPVAVLLALLALQRAWGFGLVPGAVVVSLLALAWTAGLRRAWPEARQAPLALATLLLLSAFLVLAPLVEPGGAGEGAVLHRAVPVLLGWSLVFWLPGIGREGEATTPLPRWLTEPRRLVLVFAVIGYGAFVLVMQERYSQGWAVLQDEALYLAQGGLLSERAVGWVMPPSDLAFLRPEYALYRDGVLSTQYPPGWPALLAAFDLIGLERFAPMLLAVAAVTMLYRLGFLLHGRLAGALAAMLFASQAWVLDEVAGLMPHVACAVMLLAGALLLLEAERRIGIAELTLRMAGGAALGLAFAIRPLTGATVGLAVGIWMAVRTGPELRRLVRLALPSVAGVFLPLVGVLAYNAATTGSPLLFGYTAVHGELHDLGFGIRGYNYYHGGLEPKPAGDPFYLPQAAHHTLWRAWEFGSKAVAPFLLLPLTWLAMARRIPLRWRVVLAFALLPVAHVFYFVSGMRFFVELVPFLATGMGIVIASLALRDGWGLGVPLVALLALVAAASLATADVSHHRAQRSVVASANALDALHEREGRPLLVFIEERQPEAYMFRRLWQFNAGGYASPILVARSNGVQDAAFAARFPGRAAWRGQWRGDAAPITLSPLGDDGLAAHPGVP